MRALKARSRLAWGWWGVVMVDRAAARRPGTERIAGSSPGRAWCGGWTRGRENQGGWANGRPGAGMRVEDAGPEGNVGRVPTSRLQQPQCALVQRRGFAVLAIAEVLVAGSAELFHGIRDFGGHLGWAGKQGATHFPAKWCATSPRSQSGVDFALPWRHAGHWGRCKGGPGFSGKVKFRVPVALYGLVHVLVNFLP